MFSIFDGPDAHCVILSKRAYVISRMVQVFRENEATIHQVDDYAALERAITKDDSINFIMIDVDTHDNLCAQVDRLRHIRDTYPDKATILLSDEFETDEFGTHRMMLADVSLRTPVLDASLEIALLQAPVNNLVWCSRLEALRAEKGQRDIRTLRVTEPASVG